MSKLQEAMEAEESLISRLQVAIQANESRKSDSLFSSPSTLNISGLSFPNTPPGSSRSTSIHQPHTSSSSKTHSSSSLMNEIAPRGGQQHQQYSIQNPRQAAMPQQMINRSNVTGYIGKPNDAARSPKRTTLSPTEMQQVMKRFQSSSLSPPPTNPVLRKTPPVQQEAQTKQVRYPAPTFSFSSNRAGPVPPKPQHRKSPKEVPLLKQVVTKQMRMSPGEVRGYGGGYQNQAHQIPGMHGMNVVGRAPQYNQAPRPGTSQSMGGIFQPSVFQNQPQRSQSVFNADLRFRPNESNRGSSTRPTGFGLQNFEYNKPRYH